MNEGKKNDRMDGKVRMELLPWPELEEIAKVYTKGALLRHLTEVEKGNAIDEDTGCYHIAQCAWNAIAMLHFKLEEYGRAK